MSSILKYRIPFKRRKTNSGTDGRATFFLDEVPAYLPETNQTVIITHTNVQDNTNLKTFLNNLSTNTLTATFQDYLDNQTESVTELNDGFTKSIILQYNSTDLSGARYDGDCTGYIEFDVSPSNYTVLKPIESAVIVNESIPYDLNNGFNKITNSVDQTLLGNNQYDGAPNFIRGMFIKRGDTNTIFANLLKSLNLPVSDEEMKKYTRSEYGRLVVTNSATPDTIIDGVKYNWEQITDASVTTNLVVHPTTGFTGEYYGTALQPIGSYEFNKANYPYLTPITNDLYLVFEIPNGAYGEIIDGKSIKFTMPYYEPSATPTDPIDLKLGYYTYKTNPTLLEAYGTYNKRNLRRVNLDNVLSEIDLSVKDIGIRPDLNNSANYESNVVLLFSDTNKTPQGSNLTSWSSGHIDLIDGTRVFNPNAQEKALYDYNNDECIGFVALDKGFVVITHPLIVDSYFKMVFDGSINKSGTSLTNAFKTYDINGVLSTETSRGQIMTDPNYMIVTKEGNNIVWDSTQFIHTGYTESVRCDMEYLSYNTEKSLNIVCLASSDEFFKSTNDTAKELTGTPVSSDFSNFKSDTQNLYPVIITSVGIHDANGNLLAICKPTQPVKKYWYDVVSFNVKIRL